MPTAAWFRNRRRRRSSISVLFTADHAPRSVSKTVTWNELPEWQKDNEYIISGYRRVQNHWKGCIISIFSYLHNQSVNIHSHLWAAVLFLYFLATFPSTLAQSHPGITWKDVGVFTAFLSSTVFCLSSSALYHTLMCHSEQVDAYCITFDYARIVALTVGSFYPGLYYGFYHEAYFQLLYISFMTLAGCAAAYVVLHPEYAKPNYRGARTAVFIGLGLCGVIPITHMVLMYGFHLLLQMGCGWPLVSLALYTVGALIYANRIPERFVPGRFDYFFASHQILHGCVVLAALANYHGMLILLDYRLS